MKNIITAIAAVLFIFAAPKLYAQDNALKVTTYTLDNGLTVILNEDHTRAQIFGAVAVKAGSKYDPKDATGMAHYLEHMCFKGTEDMGTVDYAKEKPYLDSIMMLYDKLGATTDETARAAIQSQINDVSVRAAQYAVPNEMDRLLKSIGSTGVNAFTSVEEIVYHNSFPAHEVNKWLDLYAHRFEHPVFRLFQPELEIVYEEKNRGTDNYQTSVYEKYLSCLFKNHPYGTQTTIGLTEHLKNPSLRRMQEYYDTYFVANNMVLVMSGDFNTEEVLPMIKEKFGVWKPGKVPAFPKYEEAAFKGREEVDVKLTPIKAGILGFRTVPNLHPDDEGIEVLNTMLSNGNQTGFLDELAADNKIQIAGMIPTVFDDHGASNIFFVPKIVGQSLEDAEKQIMEQVRRLGAGDFTDAQLEAAKNSLKVDFYKKLESSDSRAYFMVQCFISGQSWNDFMKYPEKVSSITREQVMALGKKYFGDNYLAFYSKMGFPPKDKLKKPGFKPVAAKDSVRSKYAAYFDKLPEKEGKPQFVDFKKDLQVTSLNDGARLYSVNNPINSLFEARIVYDVNNLDVHQLDMAVQYLLLVGADTMGSKSFKRKMSELGCTYDISAGANRMSVTISGLEENADKAIALVHLLLTKPQADAAKLKVLIGQVKTNRKLEYADADGAAQIMYNYLIYGKNSENLTATSTSELKKDKPEDLINVMKQAMAYPLAIHYSGRKNAADVKKWFDANDFSVKTASPVQHKWVHRQVYTRPTIYVLYRKDARQTHIYYYASAKPFEKSTFPMARAFNSYFGNDMSGIVFQEIREFRSLAYSTYAFYNSGGYPGDPDGMFGFIGCQGDKTKDAIEEMHVLLTNMPEKPDHMDAVQKNMMEEAYYSKPFFRYLSGQVKSWQDLGYTEDPYEEYLNQFKNVNFNDIMSFYRQNIQNLPMCMALVGTKANIPIDELKKLGKVVIVKEKDVRVK